jgi:hypothetical protein
MSCSYHMDVVGYTIISSKIYPLPEKIIRCKLKIINLIWREVIPLLKSLYK